MLHCSGELKLVHRSMQKVIRALLYRRKHSLLANAVPLSMTAVGHVPAPE